MTPALTRALSPEELAGVVAHEAGHVRHRHLLFYLLFFMGFFIAVYALSPLLSLGLGFLLIHLAETGWGSGLLGESGRGGPMLSVVLALPLMALLVVYLRYVMGFFMRHFERQADLYALSVTGRAEPLAGALEKVAGLSGGTRDVPSWHHFSVAQRVEALYQAQADPRRIKGQAGLIKKALSVYVAGLMLVAGLGWAVSSFNWEEDMRLQAAVRQLEHGLAQNPHDHRLRMGLGVLRFESGREAEAVEDLMAAVRMAPNDPEALNGLAWVLATAKDQGLRRPKEALVLALEAVRLNPAPHIWDTLAEAYFINGRPELALAAARAALAAGPTDRLDYFRDQLERFERAVEGNKP